MALVSIVPAMTSDTTPAPYVASAGSGSAYLAFDKSGSYWTTSASVSSTWWVQIDLATAQTASSYEITEARSPDRLPTAWDLLGSNDDSVWTVVDTRSGQVWASGETKTFTVASPGAYRYYRLSVTSKGTSSFLVIGELDLLASDEPIPPIMGALSAALPALTADLSGTYTAPPPPTYTGDLAATLPAVEASLSGTYQASPVGNLAATLPALSVDLAGTYVPPAGAAPLGTLDATLPGLTATLAGTYTAPVEVIPTGTLDATLPALTAALTGSYVGPTFTGTSTRYSNDGYNYDGTAEVDYEPPVAEPPAHIRRAVVRHVHQSMPAPTLENGRPV